MGDIFFEADSHDPEHWRYWKNRIKGANRDVVGAEFQVQLRGGWKPIPEAKTYHDAARIAAERYGRNGEL